ncbi:MAG: 23S rRNA (guanosine(2251)-2'-O)-methyltransferase RlmB [Pseudomonadota bacterium]|nr:23S rRNA (guanosine(2251)-2'-O)-methyltransferase RlmB [Pseudomonadota bacterium]
MSAKESYSFIYGIHTISTLLKSNPSSIKKIFFKKNTNNINLLKIIKSAQKQEIEIVESDKDFLTRSSMTNKHQGIVCQISKIDKSNFDLDTYLQTTPMPFIAIFDSIQDPGNLGSCIRTANAAGVSLIIKRKSNSAHLSPIVHKTSSGGLQGLFLFETNNLYALIKTLKKHNIQILGTDHTSKNKINNLRLKKGGAAVILGSESQGISKSLLNLCDEIYSIPIYGTIECLNVSVATGITLYEVAKCLKKNK